MKESGKIIAIDDINYIISIKTEKNIKDNEKVDFKNMQELIRNLNESSPYNMVSGNGMRFRYPRYGIDNIYENDNCEQTVELFQENICNHIFISDDEVCFQNNQKDHEVKLTAKNIIALADYFKKEFGIEGE